MTDEEIQALQAENAKLKTDLSGMTARWQEVRQKEKDTADRVKWCEEELARRDAAAAEAPEEDTLGASPIPQDAPQETKCPHGTALVDGKGCAEPCINKLCKHPCSEHALNCLHIDEKKGKQNVTMVVKGKKVTKQVDAIEKTYCPCTGLSV